jgi:hypothetical protein
MSQRNPTDDPEDEDLDDLDGEPLNSDSRIKLANSKLTDLLLCDMTQTSSRPSPSPRQHPHLRTPLIPRPQLLLPTGRQTNPQHKMERKM